MIFLSNIEYINPTHAKVNYIHSMPLDPVYGLGKSEAALMNEGILIESLPVKDLVEGKTPILYVHPHTKKPFYEYEDVSDNLSQQSEMSRLKQQQVLTQQALDEMIINNLAPEELTEMKKRLQLMQKAIDDLVISNVGALEGGEE